MARLYVDWNRLNRLGKTTEEKVLDLEKARLMAEDEIATIIECWTGTDSAAFQVTSLQFLDDMKEDVDYLYDWATFFKKKSNIYGETEETQLQRLRNMYADLEDEVEKLKRDGGQA